MCVFVNICLQSKCYKTYYSRIFFCIRPSSSSSSSSYSLLFPLSPYSLTKIPLSTTLFHILCLVLLLPAAHFVSYSLYIFFGVFMLAEFSVFSSFFLSILAKISKDKPIHTCKKRARRETRREKHQQTHLNKNKIARVFLVHIFTFTVSEIIL